MENRYKISIDLKNKTIKNTIFRQGDGGNSVLEINLVDNGVPTNITGQTITFNFLRSDGTIVTQGNTTGVTILNAVIGNFQCILSDSALAVEGKVKAEIVLSEGGNVLTTTSFAFIVDSSIGILAIKYIASISNQLAEWQTTFTASEAGRAAYAGLAETGRATTFTASEATRTTTFDAAEAGRATGETGRVAAEDLREIAFEGMVHVDANLELSTARGGKDNLGLRLTEIEQTALSDKAEGAQYLSRYMVANSNDPDLAFEACKTFVMGSSGNQSATIIIDTDFTFAQSHTIPPLMTVLSTSLNNIITFTGTGDLFVTIAYYDAPAKFVNLTLLGNALSRGIFVAKANSSWGAMAIIENCNISGFDVGIDASYAYQVRIKGGRVQNNRIGIRFSNPANPLTPTVVFNNMNKVSNVTFNFNKVCIDADTVIGLKLEHVDFENCDIGLVVWHSLGYISQKIIFDTVWLENIAIAGIMNCQYDYVNKVPINIEATRTPIDDEHFIFINCFGPRSEMPFPFSPLVDAGMTPIFDFNSMMFFKHEEKMLNNMYKLKMQNVLKNPMMLNIVGGLPTGWSKDASCTVSDVASSGLGAYNSNLKQVVSTANWQRLWENVLLELDKYYMFIVEIEPIAVNDWVTLIIHEGVSTIVSRVDIKMSNPNISVNYYRLNRYTPSASGSYKFNIYPGLASACTNTPIKVASAGIYDITYLVSLGFTDAEIQNIITRYVGFTTSTSGLGFGRTDPNGDGVADVPYGPTTSRPTLDVSFTGYHYFDTTLGIGIDWNGTAWVNGAGVVV